MAGSNSGCRNATVGEAIPETLAEELSSLDDDGLREIISYVQTLLNRRTAPAALIEEGSDEEIVSLTEQDGYTLVAKKQPCAAGCEQCPHGPYLYRVRAEPSATEDDRALHWSFLGHIET